MVPDAFLKIFKRFRIIVMLAWLKSESFIFGYLLFVMSVIVFKKEQCIISKHHKIFFEYSMLAGESTFLYRFCIGQFDQN
jgi:hypothetical protein